MLEQIEQLLRELPAAPPARFLAELSELERRATSRSPRPSSEEVGLAFYALVALHGLDAGEAAARGRRFPE
jgi:hypothetical protein